MGAGGGPSDAIPPIGGPRGGFRPVQAQGPAGNGTPRSVSGQVEICIDVRPPRAGEGKGSGGGKVWGRAAASWPDPPAGKFRPLFPRGGPYCMGEPDEGIHRRPTLLSVWVPSPGERSGVSAKFGGEQPPLGRTLQGLGARPWAPPRFVCARESLKEEDLNLTTRLTGVSGGVETGGDYGPPRGRGGGMHGFGGASGDVLAQ